MEKFKDLFEDHPDDFKIAVPYDDDAEDIQKELKKAGIKSEVRHKNAVSYVMGNAKKKHTKLIQKLADDNDGDVFWG